MNPLEVGPEGLQELLDAVIPRLKTHLATLPDQLAAHQDTEEASAFARRYQTALPEEATPLETVIDGLFSGAIPRSYNTAGPGYMAYIPGGGLLHAAVADLIANAVNRYVGVYVAAPVLTTIEAQAVRWLCDLVEFGNGSLGFLTTGGSLANFSAIVVARRERLPEDFLSGRLYVSEHVHHSVQKSAMLAGFPARAVRTVPGDDRFRMRPDALRDAIRADRDAGRRPFLIVGSAGTTNTGAVDDLETLADIAAEEDCALHVDAAYGGFFLLTERGRARLKGIERADSVTLDPHKGLFLPYGTGALVVRDGAALRRTHHTDAAYMPAMQTESDRVDYNAITPELSRDFRGLRVWLPLTLCGARAFRDALNEKLDLTEMATEHLRALPHVRIVAEPELSIVAFRYEPPDVDDLDALNRALLARVNARNRVHLTGTVVNVGFVTRICVLHFRTHADRVRMALEDIETAMSEL